MNRADSLGKERALDQGKGAQEFLHLGCQVTRMSSVSKILRIRFSLATGTEQVFCKQKKNQLLIINDSFSYVTETVR